MREFREPIKSVLRNYCHVEWYEVDELAVEVETGRQKFDVKKLKLQFEALVNSGDDHSHQINQLTSNEFESGEEAKVWLRGIYHVVFR